MTATAAPALMPSSPGSAKGLRVTACITAPATPKARPARIATIVRGIRNSRIIRCWSFWISGDHKASNVSPSGIDREPSARLARTAMPSTSRPAQRPHIRRWRNETRKARLRSESEVRSDVIYENARRQYQSAESLNNSQSEKTWHPMGKPVSP